MPQMLPHHLAGHLTEQGSPLIEPSAHRVPSPFIPETASSSSRASSASSSPSRKPCRRYHESIGIPSEEPLEPEETVDGGPLAVTCEVRTRIPSEFGGVCYVHLYSNNLKNDNEEHLAIVYGEDIVSETLEAIRPDDTVDERLRRGTRVTDPWTSHSAAVVNGNGSHAHNGTASPHILPSPPPDAGAPLARIHSCCFTGETLRSLRCDCAEQLEEAMRMMAKEGRGVVLYLKQEGRGIGLRDKLRAYNLIDDGYDTMMANILLRKPADARRYGIASAILRDLGINRIRLLTNNPDKMKHLAKDGVEVVERVPMIPASWRRLGADVGVPVEKVKKADSTEPSQSLTGKLAEEPPSSLVLLDRDEYLVTKVQRMGHILDIPAPLLQARKRASESQD
ncbi:GTP cyclohydrolase II [Gaertneriomyces sp. JEL0708]|nr:GTP cyclohydrolase II [Gaertneriomyces sp. JEL0708]